MILIPEMKTWYGMTATLGTIGRFSKMPGTLGSMAACALWLAFGGLPIWAIIAVIVAGTAASDKYEKEVGREDPPEVVIDEVAGCWIACWGFDLSYAIVSLFLFRIIDITKPFPVRQMEKLPGGIMVNILIRCIHWIFFEGGINVIYGYFGR